METEQIIDEETEQAVDKETEQAVDKETEQVTEDKETEQIIDTEITEETRTNETGKSTTSPFKRPVLVGKIGRLPRKIITSQNIFQDKTIPDEFQDTPDGQNSSSQISVQPETTPDVQILAKPIKAPAQQLTENSVPLPYKEPSWSGLPQSRSKEYIFEVLKSGVIVEQINLMAKPFWVFGRSPNSEIYMAHPTISRYHAVLQYRKEGTEEDPPGFYIYDLSSTHGTFLNKGRLKPRVYAPVKVGHMIKLGFSTRSYVLTGPEEDTEEESEFTLTELKQQRAEKLLKQELAEKEALQREEKEKEEKRKRDAERGVDWGLGEDADEETDLAENPYAQSNNEELYIDDPKKALRGFMEREGYDLEYDCTEQGFGQFLCKVELPLDDDRGRSIVAEVLHKGKKKEAVIQCALEACRILDRYGVLRQATHESRKRKAKNWEENDFYDSDDDTFLDRTGSIEKKREKRMNSKVPQQPETYQSLLEKEKNISEKIAQIEQQLSNAKTKNLNKSSNAEEDSLDSYMKELKQSKLDKQTISKLKSELLSLKVEHTNVVKLVNLAKPADLPPLVINNKNSTDQQGTSGVTKTKALPIFGKRPKIKVQLPLKPTTEESEEKIDTNEEEEEEEEMETKVEEEKNKNIEESVENKTQTEVAEAETNPVSTEAQNKPTMSKNVEKKLDNVPCHIKVYLKITELEKLLTENKFPAVLDSYVIEVRDVLQKVKDLTEHEGRIQSNKKTIMAKNLKVKKHIDNLMESYNEQHLVRICKEFQRICVEIRDMTQKQHKIHNKIRILLMKIDLLCKEILKKISELKENEQSTNESKQLAVSKSNEELLHSEDDEENDKDDDGKQLTPEELEKRRKKNQRRLQHRRERAEIEKQRGYQEDARKADYNMWVPPEDQTGDGRTTLNEKYGY